MGRPCSLQVHSEEPQDLPRSSDRPVTDQRMAAVHALGHPNSPAPQTAWDPSEPGRGGGSGTAPVVVAVPTPMAPNTPEVPVLAHGLGSDLIVTWTEPAVDPVHSAATGFALRHGPAGTGTWTVVQGVSSPHELSDLSFNAAIDVELQATNAGGTSMWSVTATLTTGATAPAASSRPIPDRGPQGGHVHRGDPSAIWLTAAARERSSARWRSSSGRRHLANWLIRLFRTGLWRLARLLHLRRHHRRDSRNV